MAGGEFSPQMARLIFYRDDERCARCGMRLLWEWRGSRWSIHHRKPRGNGGTTRRMTPADGLTLCGTGVTGCHGLIESNRKMAYAEGWLVKQAEDCRNVPARVHGIMHWLTAWGSRVPVSDDPGF